jgi:hypothetical protein
MYKNESKEPNGIIGILVTLFGEYGFDIIWPPDNNGEFEYAHYYVLFGKKTYIGNEWCAE